MIGIVVDIDNLFLIGVNVVIKGIFIGIIIDLDGKFIFIGENG